LTGYERRSEAKKTIIKKCAIELFEQYGFERVTLDEIAKKAHVSRVTIYKHFENKENLCIEIVRTLAVQITEEIEAIIQTDIGFPEKVRKIVMIKRDVSDLTDNRFISSAISDDGELGGVLPRELLGRIGLTLNHIVIQGKAEGYIHPELSDESINDYFRIIRAALKQLQDTGDPLMNNMDHLGNLVSMYLAGLRHGIPKQES
jgi:AcrR family transcriptional regulator